MYSEILILAMLRTGQRHGYDIKKDVDRALGGMVTLNNKTLYLALKRFEEIGAVTRQVLPQEGKPNRHLYQLTERGIELLQASLRDFPASQAASEAEFFTRAAFFDYLEVPERATILTRRLAYLEGCLSYLQAMQHMADSQDCAPTMGISMTHAQRVLDFHIRRIHDEYQWIASWLEEMQANR
ncbi:MAG TPA: PadR family transcriptional regulator [Ktedonobacter sp.]|nr:PadR family transcriptional regulator [Ktedonobacter sp.]